MAQIKLLQSYEHEGITLPEGAVFAVSEAKADELVAKGISVRMPSVDEEGPEQSAEDQGDDADLGDAPSLSDMKPED